jgi:hypothetical protein
MKTQFSIDVQTYVDMCQATTLKSLRSIPRLDWGTCETILSGDDGDEDAPPEEDTTG